jgi:hypothetical protein
VTRKSTGWKACATTIFQSYAWNELAARLFAERERPFVVVGESDSGAAIIPACVRRDSASLLGEELFDYRDVIAVGDQRVLDAAWGKLGELGLPMEVKAVRGTRSWAEMRPFAGAPYLPVDTPLKRNKSLERNLRLLAERGRVLIATGTASPQGLKPAFFLEDYHPAEAGCSPGHATAPAINDEQRSDWEGIGILRSAQDDSSKEQIFLRARNDKSDLSGIVRRMYELKARQEGGSLFRDPLRIEAAVRMAASATTEMFMMERDDELVAAVLTFIDRDVCRFYGTYYDERWAAYSPGVSLLYRVIQQAQARELDFDLMTGEQPYKMRFASEVVPLYTAHVPAAVSLAA